MSQQTLKDTFNLIMDKFAIYKKINEDKRKLGAVDDPDILNWPLQTLFSLKIKIES